MAEVVEILTLGGYVADYGLSPTHDKKITYKAGQMVVADKFDDNPRTDCAGGIHYFITRKEAEEWLL
jgi:hypothetical protein